VISRTDVLWLAGLGVVIGVASLFATTQGLELWLWLVAYGVAAFVLGRAPRERPVRRGFLAGVLMGASAPLIQALFYPQYITRNDPIESPLAGVPDPLFLALLAVPSAIIAGLMVALLTWIVAGVSRLFR
jgi:hypothetical protein